MAILIGIWESIVVLVVFASLTTLALCWYWRRRLLALGQKLDRQHEKELDELRQDLNRQHQTELDALRQDYDRHHLAEVRDMIREFKHQAANCLNPIKHSLQQVKKEMQSQTVTELLEASLKDIERYEWRLTRLIENMAFVIRLEAPNLHLPFSEVKLDVIVSDVVGDFFDLDGAEGRSLSWWAVPESFPRITANEESLRQVFINMIDNAIKYCQEKDEIDVALEANVHKNVTVARVSDTGPGIPEEDWELIFQKGYTVEGARGRKPKEGSQGLGLYIAKLVVEKHGGTIEVTSRLGKGTTFIITLPIQRI
jgi:two-component system phosphate regulon sensor histidine kinase PhoR